MTFVRWSLHDPSGTLTDWTFRLNPNQMEPQQLLLAIEPAPLQEDGANSDRQMPTQALQWQFQGTLLTLADVDMLETWLELGLPVTLTDHFGYQFNVVFTAVDTVRAPKRRNPGEHTYTVHALLLNRIGV